MRLAVHDIRTEIVLRDERSDEQIRREHTVNRSIWLENIRTQFAGRKPVFQHIHCFIEDGDGLKAAVIGLFADGMLHITDVWVEESMRGRGIATRLMQEIEARARTLGAARVRLESWSYGPLKLYERLGYDVVGTVSGYADGSAQYYLCKDL